MYDNYGSEYDEDEDEYGDEDSFEEQVEHANI